MSIRFDNEQETAMVERQVERREALAIVALLPGADRELDSSITIKRIVSHLFQRALSLAATKRCSKLQTAKQVMKQQQEGEEATNNTTRSVPIYQSINAAQAIVWIAPSTLFLALLFETITTTTNTREREKERAVGSYR